MKKHNSLPLLLLISLVACKPTGAPNENSNPIVQATIDTTTTKRITTIPPNPPPVAEELIPPSDILVLNKDISLVKSKSNMILWGEQRDGDPIHNFTLKIIKKDKIEVLNFFHNSEAYMFTSFEEHTSFNIGINTIKGIYLLGKTIRSKAPLVLEYKINDKICYVNIPTKKLNVTKYYTIPRDSPPGYKEKFLRKDSTQTQKSNN